MAQNTAKRQISQNFPQNIINFFLILDVIYCLITLVQRPSLKSTFYLKPSKEFKMSIESFSPIHNRTVWIIFKISSWLEEFHGKVFQVTTRQRSALDLPHDKHKSNVI